MNNLITEFKKYCTDRKWTFDKYCSEFTFQFRLCRFLENNNKSNKIELESNIERYNYNKLIKKEIDIDLLTFDNKKIAIEIKFIRDQGSFNIGMYKYCEDIKFLEELTDLNFLEGYAILFTTIKELYTPPQKKQNPRNIENISLYNCFRVELKLKGNLKIKTGKMNESLTLRNEYEINWIDFDENIKACIVKVEK